MSTSIEYGIANSEDKEENIKIQTNEKFIAKDEEGRSRKGNFFQMFKFSSKLDILLILVGLFFSIISGVVQPLAFFFLSDATDTFIKQMTLEFQGAVNHQQNNVTFYNNSNIIFHSITPNTQNFSFSVPKKSTNNVSSESWEFHKRINLIFLLYVAIGIISLISSFIQIFSWEYSSERRVKRLRQLYFSQVIRQDISWFDTHDDGNLSNKLSDDLERMRDGTGYKFSMVFQYISTVIFNLLISFIINVKLTLIAATAIPVVLILSIYCGKLTAKSAILEQQQYAVASAIAEETLTNIKTVAAFDGQSKEIKRYDKAVTQGRKIAMSKYNSIATITGIIFSILYGISVLVFWFWVEVMREESTMSGGNVISIFLYASETAVCVVMALPFLDCIGGAAGVATTIKEIILQKPEIDSYSMKGSKCSKLTGQIEFKNVHFSYPSRPDSLVLKGLNLKIEPGKTVAIVGPSGAGKSTIVSLILRFYDVLRGQVLIDNISLSEYNIKWLRNQIGLVSQEPVLFGVSIAENILYGSENASMEDVVNASRKANAHDFIIKFPKGYDTMVGDTGSQLSGGQKQRIAIARALIRDPKILLLDEATSALDSISEEVVQQALEKAMKGRTTIIIAHRLSTIRNADVICVMQDGVLYESGTHDDLMKKQSLYYNLVTTQKSETKNQIEEGKGETGRKRTRTSSYDLKKSKHRKSGISTDSKKMINDDDVTEHLLAPDLQSEDDELLLEIVRNNENKLYIHQTEKIYKSLSLLQFIQLQKSEWKWLLVGFIGCIGTGISIPICGYYIGNLIEILPLSGYELLNSSKKWCFVYLLMSICSGFSFYMQAKGMAEASKKLIARTRILVFQNILRQPVGWFDEETSSPGILVNRLARTAPLIEAASGGRAGRVLASSTTVLAGLILAVMCNWMLASLCFVIIPILLFLGYKQQIIQKKHQMRDSKLLEEAGRVASETIRNIRTVKALGQENLFIEIYVKHLKLPYKEARNQAISYALLFAVTQSIMSLMFAMSFKFGGYLFEQGYVQASDVFKVAFSLSFCVYPLIDAFSYLQDNTKARTAVKLLNYLLNRKSNIDASSPEGLNPEIKGDIQFKDVHFSYPTRTDTKVLDGISFNIEAGKSLALVGESGCGKSTVISLLERFYDVESGIIKIDGYDIKSLNLSYLRSNIGLITQEPILFNMTIKENIAYGRSIFQDNITFEEIQRAAKMANVHDFIMSLPNRYDTIAGERGVQLSGGQKQRLAIARALIRNPKILMLDEATSALDSESEKVVQIALDEAKQGRTSIIVAHRLSTIKDVDKICVISRGRVVESGTHAQLLEIKGHYYNLIQKQV